MLYIIDQEKKTCVCKMSRDFDNAENEYHKKSNAAQAADYICGKMKKAYSEKNLNRYSCSLDYDIYNFVEAFAEKYVKDEYVGKSKCCDTDNFDVDTGKRIARARCLKSFYNDIVKASDAFMSLVDSMYEHISDRNLSARESVAHWTEKSVL